ncbi:hypothetical protein IGI04_007395 [Brassica rapa subsp. trilocularis]|uniref:Reverse transcriptase zinc-binding domain-containing protein n=1 Tax=Brassica rapa subsp. trilocularis TaxID=1813537 RepID=A0ABQ7NJL6_BRACM|nr:hypothetical protein IGI04_007395 [Brassica rapa subsp. trilocularis]
MAATKIFSDLEDFWDDLHVSRLKYNALDDFQEVFQTTSISVVWTSWKSSGLPGSRLDFLEVSRLDFLEVVWTSWKSSGLHGSLLTNHLNVFGYASFSDLDLICRRLPGSLPDDFHFSRLDFLKVVWTSWKSSRSRLEVVWTSWKSSDKVFFHIKWKVIFAIDFEICYLGRLKNKSSTFVWLKKNSKKARRLTFQSSQTTYNSIVRPATYIRLKCKSSRKVLWRFFCNQTKLDDLTFSRLRKQISKSIEKITSALTRRLPAHIRLLQEHIISNESDPPRIVSFFDSMNHKKCRIKILEWRKKKGKSILVALRASNWLFMVVRILMTMAII